jgi:ribosome modulation factor
LAPYYKDNVLIYRKLHLFEITNIMNSVWYEGYRAFLRGEPSDAPFKHQTPDYYSWNNGWHSARQDFIEQRARDTNEQRPENS